MSLPGSRNTNYSPGATALRGNDLNDFQDCIIGKKYPSTPLYIPGTSWRVVQGSPTLDSNGLWTFPTFGTSELTHDLMLYPGTRITSLVFSFDRNSNNTSGEFDFKLYKRALGSAPSLLFSDVISTGTGLALRDSIASALAGVAQITADGFMYWISVGTATAFSGAPKFDGSKIVIDRL
jgi:hypothetical protein